MTSVQAASTRALVKELGWRAYDTVFARAWVWRVRDRVCVALGGNPA
ncbi:hypothetical protein MHPYR_170005 [uncultured Mycobacterium sp.]|uniref:Uncharacterized protein n=1 Tax=uncultured Mycobacterium sp. TaxID=171292 RepID=A0A1Y5P423_9MYCO|nr:hypothetical protein MHPYR_170005 [uncultured Mycobacterium sp.]